ncbi:hypothetical protein ACMA1I_20345 [Pontibacter sp. 13R65]|uniref:hypothetical protein n=1 Tax=Pontibacter sp. 13R65 TaxID=3127458 RepID=UPI00301D7AC4
MLISFGHYLLHLPLKLAAALPPSFLLLALINSSCSDNKEAVQHQLPGKKSALFVSTSSPLDTAPYVSIPFTPAHAISTEEDYLLFREKLAYTIYNRNINKDMLSSHVSTSASSIPATVAHNIATSFYDNLRKNKNSKLEKESFAIRDVQLYETVNDWKVYFIFIGTEFETTAYLTGCFDEAGHHFVLKEAFGHGCATFSFKAPNPLPDGLQFQVYENYSCQEGKEEIFHNTFTISTSSLQHARQLYEYRSAAQVAQSRPRQRQSGT